MIVVVPSRGRPGNADELVDAWEETGAHATLLLGLDTDDLTLDDYPHNGPVIFAPDERLGMAGTLNRWAKMMTGAHGIIGFMGDDHRPRTREWDRLVLEAVAQMGGTGIVYGNDLLQGARLPTAVFITSDIVRALGYMAPPCLRHMFLDNYWKDLGTAAGCLRYLPDVVIEHMHPEAGKADVDRGYQDVWPLMDADRTAYDGFVTSGGLAADVAKVKALL